MKRLGLIALGGLLAGCQSMPTAPSTSPRAPVDADVAQRARAEALGLAHGQCAVPAWSLTGRVGLSNGKDGGSGRLEWTQGAGATHLMLSAPITRQTWTLDVDGRGATLQGGPKGPLRGSDAARLLRDATGWEIPVEALGCWVRAVAADAGRFGAASLRLGGDGLPAQLQQGGWTVDYDGWKPDPLSPVPMPTTITAQNGQSRVRVLVDRWGTE